jgi:hypothetical protein
MDARIRSGHDERICVAFMREHGTAISPQVCARLILNFRHLKIRGRRECRAPMRPQPRV